MNLRFVIFTSAVAGAYTAHAQSINLDWQLESGNPVPSNSYAAAGLAGYWNAFSSLSVSGATLFGLGGGATSATLTYSVGSISRFFESFYSGDDLALMDEAFQHTSGQHSFSFSGLIDGTYKVILYGMRPYSFSGDGGTWTLGGVTKSSNLSFEGWPGSHEDGVTYVTYDTVVSGGNLSFTFDDGFFNGMQLIHQPESVPEPLTMALGALGAGVYVRKKLKHKTA